MTGSIEALTAALTRNSDLLERVIAGQEAAIAKLEGGSAPRTTRSRKAAAEEVADAGKAAPASTASGDTGAGAAANDAPAASPLKAIIDAITDADTMKAFVQKWTQGTEDADERKKRVDLLKAIAQHLGVETKFDALVPHKAQTVFYIERSKAGCSVDFAADYDFDGDPAQGGAPAASDDDFG